MKCAFAAWKSWIFFVSAIDFRFKKVIFVKNVDQTWSLTKTKKKTFLAKKDVCIVYSILKKWTCVFESPWIYGPEKGMNPAWISSSLAPPFPKGGISLNIDKKSCIVTLSLMNLNRTISCEWLAFSCKILQNHIIVTTDGQRLMGCCVMMFYKNLPCPLTYFLISPKSA